MADLLVAVGILAANGLACVVDGVAVARSADGGSVIVESHDGMAQFPLVDRKSVVIRSMIALSKLRLWNVQLVAKLVNVLGEDGRLMDRCTLADCSVDGSVCRSALQLIKSVSDLAKRMDFVLQFKVDTLNCWLNVKCSKHVDLLTGFLHTTRSDWSFLLRCEAFHHVLSTILTAVNELTDRDASVIGRLLRVAFVESRRQHCLLIGNFLPGSLSDGVLIALLVDLHRKFAFTAEEFEWYWPLVERNVNKRQVFYLMEQSQSASSMQSRLKYMVKHVELDIKMQPLLVKAVLRVMPFVSDTWMADFLMELIVNWHSDFLPIVRCIISRMDQLENIDSWQVLLPLAIDRFLDNLEYSMEDLRLVNLIQASVYERASGSAVELGNVCGCRYVPMECNRLLHGALGLASVRSFCELVSWKRLFQGNPIVEDRAEYCTEHLHCRVSNDQKLAGLFESENGQILQALAHVEPFEFLNPTNFGAVLLFECTLCKGQFGLERRLLLDSVATAMHADLSIIVDDDVDLKERLMHAAAMEAQFGHLQPGSAIRAEPAVIDSVMTRHAMSLGANSLDVWQAITRVSCQRWRPFLPLIYGLERNFGDVGLDDILELCTDPSAIMLYDLHQECFLSMGRKLMGNMINVVFNHGSKLPLLSWLVERVLDDAKSSSCG